MAKKTNNLKSMKENELVKELTTLQESLRVMHFKAEGSKSKNVKEGAALKKQIARVMTAMNQVNKK